MDEKLKQKYDSLDDVLGSFYGETIAKNSSKEVLFLAVYYARQRNKDLEEMIDELNEQLYER